MLEFEVVPKGPLEPFIDPFEFIYSRETVFPEPFPVGWGGSLSLNFVELYLSGQGIARSAGGFCPRVAWKPTECAPPPAPVGDLRIITDLELDPGWTMRIHEENGWLEEYFNPRSGWLCIGDPGLPPTGSFQVAIRPNMVAVGIRDDLISLWLHIARFEG